ncbi:MAG: hypothetical protein RLY45_62 [Actinomycetota bacterium]|jgi:YidC/Oxa1 family membrane protein insertase
MSVPVLSSIVSIGFFEPPAALLAWFYSITHSYVAAISLIALVVMLVTSPLVLKSTKGMLEMQRLQPELRALQQQHRGDRQKLNEEMMKLYQEHRVNPLASCLPLLLQMPVFIIMFQVLTGISRTIPDGAPNAGAPDPKYISTSSEMYRALIDGDGKIMSWGLDLAVTPWEMFSRSFGTGLVYGLLVAALGFLYWIQQRMVASRATVSPQMSAAQQKIFQYLPVVFAVFLVFYLTGLVVYYMAQAVIRIGLNWYITHRFYKGDESLGRQAQAAGQRAREMAAKDGGGGMFAQLKRDAADTAATSQRPTTSKRVTPPKNAPTSGRGPTKSRPASTGKAGRRKR